MSAGDRDNLSPGAADVRDRFAADFFAALWERPDVRKRWVLRQRNEAAVREVADGLAWSAAVNVNRILPTDILGPTIRHAVLDDFAQTLELNEKRSRDGKAADGLSPWDLPLTRPVAKMLDWFIRHHPDSAQWRIGEIMHEAHRRWEIPAQVTGEALLRSVAMDGKLDEDTLKEYFARVTPGKPST